MEASFNWGSFVLRYIATVGILLGAGSGLYMLFYLLLCRKTVGEVVHIKHVATPGKTRVRTFITVRYCVDKRILFQVAQYNTELTHLKLGSRVTLIYYKQNPHQIKIIDPHNANKLLSILVFMVGAVTSAISLLMAY